MAYIKQINLGTDSHYLIEPILYAEATTSNSGETYTASLDSNFELVQGVCIQIKFPSTNKANATLNTKYIYYNNDKIAASTLKANHVYNLVYDGTQWQLIGDIDTNTTYTNGTGLNLSGNTFSVKYGTTAGTAAEGNDSRLSDARTPLSHTHGNIQNNGTLQTDDVTIANGDKLIITDASNDNKIARSSLSFGSAITTQNQSTEFLRKDGTWAAPSYTTNTDHHDWNDITNTPTTLAGYGITDAASSTHVHGNLTNDGKLTEATQGVATDGNKKLISKDFSTSSPSVPSSGTTTASAFIDTISQDAQGKITATKKNVQIPLSSVTGASDIQAIEALTGTSGFLKKTAADTWSLDTNTYSVSTHTHGNINNNGTIGGTDITNRLVYTDANQLIDVTGHYASSTKVAINSTSAPTENFYVNGTAQFYLGASDTSSNNRKFIIQGASNNKMSIAPTGIQVYNSSNAVTTMYLQAYGGSLIIGGSDYQTATRDMYGVFDFKSTSGFKYSAIGTASATYDIDRPIWIMGANSTPTLNTGVPVTNSSFTFNAKTNTLKIGTGTLTATNYSGKAATAGTADIGSTVTITTHTNTTNGNKTYYMPFFTATSGNLSPHVHSSVYLYETVSNNAISAYDFCFGASAIQGRITLWDGSSHYGNIRTVNLSTNRTYDLPNQAGTFALLTKTDANALINLLDTGSSDLTANDYVITQYVGGGTTTTTYHRRPASKVINATLVKAALGTNASSTAKKFLKDTGSWAQVDWGDLTGKPSTFAPSAHEHSYIGKDGFIAYPSDGKTGYNGTQTGYIRIKIPQTKSATMFSFDVDIYNYTADQTTRYHIAGYNYDNASWNCTTAYCTAPLTNEKANLTVRFVSDGDTNMYVCIGDTDTSWSYPKITVHSILINHSGATLANWKSGWTVDLVNDAFNASQVKSTKTNTNIAYKTAAANLTTTKWGIAYYSDIAGTFAGTDAGTSGQYLKSNGTSAPTWASFPTTLEGYGITDAAASDHTHGNITNDGKMSGSTVSGDVATTDKFLREDGTWTVPAYTTNTDSKVSQTASTTAKWRKLLLGHKEYAAYNTAITGETDVAYEAVGISAQPSTGSLRIAGSLTTGSSITAGGLITAKANQYTDGYTGALNMSNSNIYGVNSIYTADAADSASEGIHFYRSTTTVDSLWINGGNIYFAPNRTITTDTTTAVGTTAANSEKVLRLPASITGSRVVYSDESSGKLAESTTTSTELGYVHGVTSAIQTQLDTKAPLASPEFTGTPTSPTPQSTSDDTMIATKEYVDGIVTAADAMVFKGTRSGAATSSNEGAGGLTPAANCGDTYKVEVAGFINGEPVEVGDILICTTDNTDASTSSNYNTIKDKWVIIQNNVDGAVFRGANAFVDSEIIIADSTAGKVKSSGKTINTSTPSSSSTDAQIPTAKAVWAAIDALDGNLNNTTPGSGKTVTSFSQTNGKVSIKFENISITKSQVSDFSHTHSYAASSSAGGSATYVATTEDTSNTLYLTGVTSAATTTLKYDSSITMKGGTLTATSFVGDLTGDVTGDITGTASNATTTADTTNTLYAVGVTSNATSTLKHDTSVTFTGDTVSATTYEGAVLSLKTAASNPSLSAGARILFGYTADTPQTVGICYIPNDSYRNPAGLKIMGGTNATPAWFEVEGALFSKDYTHFNSNGIVDATLVMGTRGKKPTATTTDDTTTYSGAVTGTAILTLGNNKVSANSASGVDDNACGYLYLYDSGSNLAKLTAYSTRVYPETGLAIPTDKIGIMFRPNSSTYYTHVSYETNGNEALVFATQNSVTSFIFVNGESYANVAAARWTKLDGASGNGPAPGLQIKKNCVSIGKLIPSGTNPTYKLEVNGTTYFNGITTINNSVDASTTAKSSQLIVQNAKDAPGKLAIELIRGTTVNSSYASWQIAIEGGDLHFRNNYDGSGWTTTYVNDIFSIVRNTGAATFIGTVTASAFSGNASSATEAKWLMNRGTNVTIADSSWSHGQTGAGGTNTTNGIVWKQKWTQSGLTYTPSGGSATTLSDSGDMVLWLSQASTSDNLYVNMAIDGYIYSMSGFKGGMFSVSGQSTISYAAPTGSGMLNITSSSAASVVKSGTWSWGINHLVTNLAAGGNTCFITGRANSTNNSAVLSFHYAGSNNADNTVGLGLYSNNDLLTVNKAGVVKIKSTTDASSTTTGTLVISGGAGIAKTLYVGTGANITGITTINNTTAVSTAKGSSQLQIMNTTAASGNVVALELYRGATTSTTNGWASWQLAVDAGIFYIRSDWGDNNGTDSQNTTYAHNIMTLNHKTGVVNITATADSSSTSTGALVLGGGLGVAKKVYVGTGIYITSTSADNHINFARTGGHNNPNYINVPASSSLAISVGGYGGEQIVAMVDPEGIVPFTTNTKSIGTSTYKWSAIYATTYYGALECRASTSNLARHVWFSYSTNGTTEDEGVLGKDDDFKYNPNTNVLTVGKLTITGGTTDSTIASSGTLDIANAAKALTISTTTAALGISSTTGAMTLSTTTGALTVQTNGASGANLILKTAGNSGTVTLQSTKSSVSISSGTTMSISSTTSTSISSATTMSISSTTSTSISATTTMSISSGSGKTTTINSGSTLYLQRTSTASIIFCGDGTAAANYHGGFNPSGNFWLETGANTAGTQNTHKLYVKGDSAFEGKIAFATAASNAITNKAYMQWNATDLSIDFIFA